MVTLREIADTDLQALYEHQADAVANEIGALAARDREDFFAHWAKILADPSGVNWAILLDGELVGHVSAFTSDDLRLVGYRVSRQAWGRGVATAALEQLLGIVGERPLHARVAKKNDRSIRVLEKCGFVRCGERQDGEVPELLYVLR